MDEYVVKDKWQQLAIIALVCAISFMITFDYNSLNISLSPIAKYFNVKIGVVAWLPMIYLLIISSTLLGFGKLGDMIGYKKVFILGVGVFAAGGVLCAIAPTFNLLFLSRALQSLGQAMYSPICIALLTTFLPSNMKGRALGLNATFQGLGTALGSPLGGLINSNFSWRGNFLIAVPIALLIILAAMKVIPSKQAPAKDKKFDYLGAVLLFVTMVGLLFGVNQGTKMGWTSPMVAGSLIAFLIAVILFIFQEKRVGYPLLDLGLFKNRSFTFAALASFLALALNIGIMFLMPFYLQLMRHLNIAQTGLILMSPSIISMCIAPFAGNISDRIGSRKLCVAGMALVTLAFIMFAFFSPEVKIRYIVLSLLCLGAGMGLFSAPNNKLVMSQAPADKQGVASGVYKIALNSGASIGIALFMLVLAQVVLFDVGRMNIMLTEVRQYPAIMMAGFRGAFLFGIGLGILNVIFSFLAKDNIVLDNQTAKK